MSKHKISEMVVHFAWDFIGQGRTLAGIAVRGKSLGLVRAADHLAVDVAFEGAQSREQTGLIAFVSRKPPYRRTDAMSQGKGKAGEAGGERQGSVVGIE